LEIYRTSREWKARDLLINLFFFRLESVPLIDPLLFFVFFSHWHHNSSEKLFSAHLLSKRGSRRRFFKTFHPFRFNIKMTFGEKREKSQLGSSLNLFEIYRTQKEREREQKKKSLVRLKNTLYIA
jgi:hypothetical protein